MGDTRMDCSLRPPGLSAIPCHPRHFHRSMGSFNSFQHMAVASCFACSVRHHVMKPRHQKVRNIKPRRFQLMSITMAANSGLNSEMDVLQSEVARLLEEV